MTKKIDQSTIKHLQILCYEVVLGEMIDQETMNKTKIVVENYLNKNGYKIDYVKCDEELNTPDIIDSNQMKIEIVEQDGPNTDNKKVHTIIL